MLKKELTTNEQLKEGIKNLKINFKEAQGTISELLGFLNVDSILITNIAPIVGNAMNNYNIFTHYSVNPIKKIIDFHFECDSSDCPEHNIYSIPFKVIISALEDNANINAIIYFWAEKQWPAILEQKNKEYKKSIKHQENCERKELKKLNKKLTK